MVKEPEKYLWRSFLFGKVLSFRPANLLKTTSLPGKGSFNNYVMVLWESEKNYEKNKSCWGFIVSKSYVSLIVFKLLRWYSKLFPIRPKLNVLNTFRSFSGRHMNALRTFSSGCVSTGFSFVYSSKLILPEIMFCEINFGVDEFSGILKFIWKSAKIYVCEICYYPTHENRVVQSFCRAHYLT